MEFTLNSLNEQIAKVTLAFKHWQFGNKQQLAFLEDLYLLINDGIPANRAVDMMSQVTKGLTREVALSLSQKIGEGQPLAEGMREWFSMNVVEIIRVGESGGALAQTIKSAINMLSQQGVAIGAFVGAVSYPLLVIVIACVVILYLKRSVFTQFEMIKPIAQWPDAGQRLVHIAGIIQSYWWVSIVVVVAVMVIFKRLMSNYTGELRSSLDKIPPFSFYRRLASARLLETLGLLVANGVVFKSAIKVMQYQANPYMLTHLSKMEHLLSMGKTNIADVLATGLVDENDLMRLRVMAEVKGFEHGLIRMGIRGTEQATQTLKFIARIVGGIFLAVGGILIIVIIQGIYLTGMSLAA
ncbi:Toxin coregulated pilus biosynthesis protein E [Aquicella siphonis]|uniref:Toxin coregulated pilus biosynthesis protein E n=1 Tax=Aquicella siphonis TaxID=254247 RepID=A0A5E4PIK7_9COXI|nr:type II secretion system F family protein [Aquicella siphonis]VVC76889.1 Toxin coregulated pilus biosynthesis protein E [Aquicella siphonis]